MSRIDEALRRTAKARGLGGPQVEHASGEPLAAHAGDVSILDRFASEGRSTPRWDVQPATAHAGTPSRADRWTQAVSFHPALKDRLVVGPDIEPVVVEQYRRLAAVLHDMQRERGLKTLMVSSALPQEGKTLTISNLALTLSDAYHQRVLLIDADLRRPTVHTVFAISNDKGLSNVLLEGPRAAAPVEISPCLSVLTAGRPVARPLALLTSDHVRAVIDDAASHFDWVLVDAPPVGLLPDAQLVARLTDGVLFVIAAGATPYELVKRCIGELGAERIVGSVLNRVKRTTLPTDSYGGYYSEVRR